MARVLGHRQTKGAATENPNLRSPRHIPTLPKAAPAGGPIGTKSGGSNHIKSCRKVAIWCSEAPALRVFAPVCVLAMNTSGRRTRHSDANKDHLRRVRLGDA